MLLWYITYPVDYNTNHYFITLGDDYEYTGGSGDGYQRSSKRSYHGSSSGGTASASSYHPYRR